METTDESKAPDAVSTAPAAAGVDSVAKPSHPAATSTSGIKRKATASSQLDPSKRAAVTNSSSATTPFHIFDSVPAAACLPYKECLLAHFFPSGRSSAASEHSLPGPQPASLTRGELRKIEQGEYWVCEKSDGERCILLVQRDSRHVVLVDRKWSCRRMKQDHANVLVALFATRGDTVVDAELIEVAADESGGGERKEAAVRDGPLYRITMFDVLCFNGERTAEQMFGGRWNADNASDGSGRMDVIVDRIHKPYQQHMQAARAAAADSAVTRLDAHFELHAKDFVAKHHVERILSRIAHAPSPNPHFTHHTYTHGSRSNSNDGLIFTPDTADYYCRTTPLLKWKWPDLNTVDYVVYPPYAPDADKGLPLYCAGNTRRAGGGGLQKADILFDHMGALDEHSARWMEEVRQRTRGGGASSQQAVVECGYSRADSGWHIKTVRWDKSASNFLSTVVATMKAVMDDLQSSDIVAACKKNKFTYRRK